MKPCPSTRSVAVLCMLFKIKSNPMHHLSSVLPYVEARVTRSALVAHRHSFLPPRCRTSQYYRTFVPCICPLCPAYICGPVRAETMLPCLGWLIYGGTMPSPL